MKNLFILCAIAISFASCSSEGTTSTETTTDSTVAVTATDSTVCLDTAVAVAADTTK